MLEKAMHMNVAEYRPQRIAEMAEFYRFAEAVWNIPEIVPEKIADNSGYIGKHGENVSVYDAMMAEIMDDRNAEKARVRNRRHADRKHPENKAERKKGKQNRMHRLYGLAYEDTKYGKTVYFWDKKEGQKKFPEYEAEIFRNLKERSAEKIAREDWKLEQDAIAEDAEWEKFNAELLEYDRQLREQAESEQRKMREYRKMRELNEWLKYA